MKLQIELTKPEVVIAINALKSLRARQDSVAKVFDGVMDPGQMASGIRSVENLLTKMKLLLVAHERGEAQ